MGKGVAAAFLAGMIRIAIHIHTNFVYTLSGLIQALNKIISSQIGDANIFATCSIAQIPYRSKKLNIVNAGHCSPLLFKNNNELIQIEPSGPPLGILEDSKYNVDTFDIEEEDILIMVTDGLYEWSINEDKIWGLG